MNKKIIMRQLNENGDYDILHPETDSSMITDLQDALDKSAESAAGHVFTFNLDVTHLQSGEYVVRCDRTIQEINEACGKCYAVLAYIDLTYRASGLRKFFTAPVTSYSSNVSNAEILYVLISCFDNNDALMFFGSSVKQDGQDPQDIWSWRISEDTYEEKANMTQEISASSKPNQYPSAAAVYNAISGAVQMTQVTETVSGTDTECAINITDKLPHYAVIDNVTTTTCTINITIPNDNFNEHRILIINHNANALGAQNSGAITFIGGATTAYSIPAGSMVELCFRRINAVNILTYYNFVDAH